MSRALSSLLRVKPAKRKVKQPPRHKGANIWHPTADECRILRACAEKSARARNVIMRPGSRYNVKATPEEHERHRELQSQPGGDFNIRLISTDEDWNDTDLSDNSTTFAQFRRGVLLTEDGRAVVDFYVYTRLGFGRDYDEELQTNVQAIVEGGRMVRVEGTGDGVMWEAS